MQNDPIAQCVRSFVPGRVRLRHEQLIGLDAQSMRSLRECLLAIEGISRVEINPRLGSLLLCWNTDVIDAQTLKQMLVMYWPLLIAQHPQTHRDEPCSSERTQCCVAQQAFGEYVQRAVRWIAADVKNPKRAQRVAQNRVMLACAMGSVVSLAGSNKIHAAFGWAFVVTMLGHLWQHRKVL